MSKSFVSGLRALNPLSRNYIAPLGQKEAAMSKFISMAVALMAAVLVLTVPGLAFAQAAPAASVSGEVSLGTPAEEPAAPAEPTPAPAATPATPAATPAPATSPFFQVNSWEEYVTFTEFLRLYYYTETQKGWDTTMKESAKKILNDEVLFGRFSVQYSEITKVLQGMGQAPPPDISKTFGSFLEKHQCRKTGTKKVGKGRNQFTVDVFSPGCDTLIILLDQYYNEVAPQAAVTGSKAVADHTMKRAKEYKGIHTIVLMHAAFAVMARSLPPTVNPWKLGSSLQKREVCVFKKDGSKVCGTIEKFDDNGVVVNGQLIPLNDIRSICLGKENECEMSDNGGASNSGFTLGADLRYLHIWADDRITNGNAYMVGVRSGWNFGNFDLNVGVGMVHVPNGGMASFQSETNGKLTEGYVRFGAAFRPHLSEMLSLRLGGSAAWITSGGYALDAETALEVDVSPAITLGIGPTFGYMQTNKAFGANPAIETEDPLLEGFTFGGMGSFALYF